jgi:cytochrome c5
MSIDITWRQRNGLRTVFSVLALMALAGTGCTDKESTAPGQTGAEPIPQITEAEPAPAPQAADTEAQAPIEAAEPATEPAESQAAAESPAASVDGQKIYQASCQACHAAGVAGAPKLGDKDAWAPRIAKGEEALFASVKNGLNAMPPKGACMSCSDEELSAAITYMVAQGS